MTKRWILIAEANIDCGVEADTREEAEKKAEELLEKIMLPNMILDDGRMISVNLELQGVIEE